MKITGKIVTLILLIGFFAGLCVLLYPAVSQYWNSKKQSRAVVEYEEEIGGLSEAAYSEIMTNARSYNERLSKLGDPFGEYNKLTDYNQCLNATGTGMMGYVSIDKLQVNLPLYHGTSDEVLSKACGHLEGTSLPIGEESTHSVLSAHRGLPNSRLFTDLDKMQVGDIFTITVLGEVLTYQVDQVKIVVPTDISDLQIVNGKDYCTLMTCTPYGINTHRLLVRGVRTDGLGPKRLALTAEAYKIDRLIVTPVVAIPILFALIAYVMFKPKKKNPFKVMKEHRDNKDNGSKEG